MTLINNTSIKDYKGTNRMYAIFLCDKCNKKIEKPKRYGLIAKTCGCKTNYTGKNINGFKIIKDFGGTRRKVIAKCPYCKADKEMLFQSIVGKKSKSCGCIVGQIVRERATTHGLSTHRIYKIHMGMIQRCYNENAESFKKYGLIGISICDEWKSNIESFYKWSMENGYDDNLTIDRIDNSGNYEPSNCRWATSNIQARNTRKIQINNTSGYRGVSFIKERGLFLASITVDLVQHKLGVHKEAKECALMYDKYVNDNNLEHTTNFV